MTEAELQKLKTAPPGMNRVLSILQSDKQDVLFVGDFQKLTDAFFMCSQLNVENNGRKYYCFDDQGKEPVPAKRA
jgi:hypothetical protein